MTAPEALTCQGFPVYPESSYGTACCSWANRFTPQCDVPFPGRSVAIGQAGNSMHTEVAATILSYALFEIRLATNARMLVKVGMSILERPLSVSNHSSVNVSRHRSDNDADDQLTWWQKRARLETKP